MVERVINIVIKKALLAPFKYLVESDSRLMRCAIKLFIGVKSGIGDAA